MPVLGTGPTPAERGAGRRRPYEGVQSRGQVLLHVERGPVCPVRLAHGRAALHRRAEGRGPGVGQRRGQQGAGAGSSRLLARSADLLQENARSTGPEVRRLARGSFGRGRLPHRGLAVQAVADTPFKKAGPLDAAGLGAVFPAPPPQSGAWRSVGPTCWRLVFYQVLRRRFSILSPLSIENADSPEQLREILDDRFGRDVLARLRDRVRTGRGRSRL